MARFLLILVVLAIVLVGAALALPFLIPAEIYRGEIEVAAEEATGRDVTIEGDINLSFLPPVSIKVGAVSISNAPGAQQPVMARMKSLTLGVEILPFLLNQEVRVSRFILEEPEINLEVARDGTPNWVFEGMDTSSSPDPSSMSSDTTGGQVDFGEVSLGDVRLIDGLVRYADRQTNASYEARDINVTVGLPSLDDPLTIDGGLIYNDERISLDARIANPRAFLDNQTTDVSLDLASTLIDLDFTGAAAMEDAPNAALPLRSTGKADLDIPSVRALSAWTGSPMADGTGFGPLSIEGDIATATDRIDFNNAKLRFDEMSGTGAVKLLLSGTRPKLEGQLDLDQIDTRPYEPAPVNGGGAGGGSASAQATEWSAEPIDFSGLKAVDADVAITVGRFITSTLEMGRSTLDVDLTGGRLQADLKELALYDGSGSLFLEVDARRSVPTIRNRTSFNVIQTQPLLQDLVKSGLLKGIGNLEIDVTTRGASQRDLVAALNGTGRLLVSDGALFGINIPQLIRSPADSIAQLTLNMSRDGIENDPQQTDFAELGASFIIQNGILKTDDFNMLSPLLRLLGQGETNILSRSVNFYLDPKAVASLEGQGSTAETNGLGLPIRITGTWDNLQFTPDVQGIGAAFLERELGDGAGELLRDPGSALREGLQGVLNRPQADEETAEDGDADNRSPAEGLIRGLFDRNDDDEKEELTEEEKAEKERKKAEKKAEKERKKKEKEEKKQKKKEEEQE